MQLKTITLQSSTIFYRITGKGRPVVLIHGFGEDGAIWDRQVEFLKDHFLLIVPDLPGSGRSAMGNGNAQAGMEDYAAIIKMILVEEHISKAAIIGHSMGGYIALAFAEQYPQMLSSLGLVHSSAFADSDEKKSARMKSIEFISKNGAYEFLKTAIPGLFKEQGNPGPSYADISCLTEQGKAFSPEALIAYYKAMIARHDRTAVLKEFAGPVLFIMGVYDNAVPFQQSLQQSCMPQKSYIHILRNSAHMGMLEETGLVNSFLAEFLQ